MTVSMNAHVLYYLALGLGLSVLCFTVSAVMSALEAWGERHEQASQADRELEAIRSMATIQEAYLQAHQVMHDATERHGRIPPVRRK
jgi:hypothetical protein